LDRCKGPVAHLTTHSLPHPDFKVMANEEEPIDGVLIEAKISDIQSFDQVWAFT
jgi:hypothetical protein